MSLLRVHQVMIGLAVVFCAVFAVRGVVLSFDGVDGVTLALSVVAGIGAVVLARYLRWLLRVKGAALGASVGTEDGRP